MSLNPRFARPDVTSAAWHVFREFLDTMQELLPSGAEFPSRGVIMSSRPLIDRGMWQKRFPIFCHMLGNADIQKQLQKLPVAERPGQNAAVICL